MYSLSNFSSIAAMIPTWFFRLKSGGSSTLYPQHCVVPSVIGIYLSCHQSKGSKVDNYCSLLKSSESFNLYSFLSLLTNFLDCSKKDLEKLWSLSTHPTGPFIVFSVLPTAFQPLTSDWVIFSLAFSDAGCSFPVWEPPLHRPVLSSSYVGQSPHHLDPVCLIVLLSEKSRLAFIL